MTCDLEDEGIGESNVGKIEYLYELRHACNLFSYNYVAKKTGISVERIISLYNSYVHGSKDLGKFIKISNDEFLELIDIYEKESLDYQQHIEEVNEKNEQLVCDLKKKREQFAGIGTNKAKRRLNKLAITNSVAKAVRLALEIEDKSISAKGCYGMYRDRIYKKKGELILSLSELFNKEQWVYGIQKSEVPPTSHVIYFEIPNCEQISWHFTPESESNLPEYMSKWDNKSNSTLEKLELISMRLFEMY
jgi:hypothetical protein